MNNEKIFHARREPMSRGPADRQKQTETSRHLFQRPLYYTRGGGWTTDYGEALDACPARVHLDQAAVLSYLSFGYACRNRTLLKEISRRPWQSRVLSDGSVSLSPIPPHGLDLETAGSAAERLFSLLCQEAEQACRERRHIYLLLSGGMDSRIIAGVLDTLYREGRIPVKPAAITWGFPDSRDAVYASDVARALGWEWQNIPYGPEIIQANIRATVRHLGLIHSPELLHNMLWFEQIEPSSLVLAASYGDAIGRAEFAGRHLLQLIPPQAHNSFGLLWPYVFARASKHISGDMAELWHRALPGAPPYAHYEHWMQGYRMRGGLCHALSIINRWADIYQLFTAPQVYEYMWSLHPSCRGDEIYKAILKNKLPGLAALPWARTNRAFTGKTSGARRGLRAHYHAYTRWCAGPLYEELKNLVDPEWFAGTGIFDPVGIRRMNRLIRWNRERVGRLNDVWIWLAGFRVFAEDLQSRGKELVIESTEGRVRPGRVGKTHKGVKSPARPRGFSLMRARRLFFFACTAAASYFPILHDSLLGLRARLRRAGKKRLRKQALKIYPPL